MGTKRRTLRRVLDGRVVTLLILTAILIVAMTLLLPGTFLSASNFSGIFTSLTFDLLLSCGMTVVLILGGVDLSVGSVVALVGITTSTLVKNGFPLVPTLLIGLVIGAAVGSLNGFLVAKIGLAPFIATLGMNAIVRGSCYVLTSGYLISGLPESFTNLSRLSVFGVPMMVIISLVCAAIMAFCLFKLSVFKQMYLIGTSPVTAVLSGIPAVQLKIIGYGISGFFAALTGILMSSRYGMGFAGYAIGFESRAIAAAVIGGAVMAGGEGNMVGTLMGVILVAIVNNAFIMLNGPAEAQYAISGVMLITALILDRVKGMKKKKIKKEEA